MRKLFFVILCVFALQLEAASASKNINQPQYWLVQNVYVKANETQAYEANILELIYSIKKEAQDCSPFTWYAFVSPDKAVYSYVTPVVDFEHLEAIYQAMAQESNALAALHQSISSEVNSWDVSVLMPLNNLSVAPSNVPCVQPYNIIETIEAMPGQEGNLEQILADWAESADGSLGWSVFTTLIGPNQPQYTIVYNGASLDSFKSQFDMSSGAKGKFVSGQGLGILRGYSWSSNVYVPALSNVNQSRGQIRKAINQFSSSGTTCVNCK